MNLSSGLAAYWTLNEPSGARNDGLGVSHLVENGTVSSVAGSLAPGSARFDGNAANYLECPNNPALNVAGCSFTIAGWFNFENSGGSQTLLLKGADSTAANLEYNVHWNISSTLRFIVGNGTTTGAAVVIPPVPIANGVWHFFACWYDLPNAQLFARVDDLVGPPTSYNLGVQFGNGSLRFGNRAGTAPAPFNGRLDAIGLWKRVLTADELDILRDFSGGLDHPLKGV